MTRKLSSSKKPDHNKLTLAMKDGESKADLLAQTILRPTVQAASTILAFYKSINSELTIRSLIDALSEQTKAANDGDLGRGEAMLAAQAHTLDAIFNALACRSHANSGEYLDAAERYMRLALKAQSQCRATWETLMTIKNPPMMGYVRQANIAHGPQQVNNNPSPTIDPRARENENPQNKLLEQQDGERLDFGAAGTASGTDSEVAAVGTIDRPKNSGRKSKGIK